jgi:hypothetical protein
MALIFCVVNYLDLALFAVLAALAVRSPHWVSRTGGRNEFICNGADAFARIDIDSAHEPETVTVCYLVEKGGSWSAGTRKVGANACEPSRKGSTSRPCTLPESFKCSPLLVSAAVPLLYQYSRHNRQSYRRCQRSCACVALSKYSI